jgi:serine/threonine protein kinase
MPEPRPKKRAEERPRESSAGVPGRKAGAARIGRYTIGGYWKSAGFTESFIGRQEMPFGLLRRVVIERIVPEHAQDQEAIEALARVAKILLRLAHPNIVQLLDFGAHRGEPYLVLERIEGWTLYEIFAKCRSRRRPLPIAFVCRIASDIAAALSAMHTATDAERRSRPIAHGTLSPDCVWISRTGALKVSDFGTASEPESYAALAEREDIDAAGKIVFEAAVLEHLEQPGTSFEELVRAAREGRIEGPAAHPEAKPLLARALGSLPHDRYKTALDFQLDFERLLVRIGQTATPEELASWLDQLFSQ